MYPDQNLKEEFDTKGRVWMRQALSEADLSRLDDAACAQGKAGQRVQGSTQLDAVLSVDSSLLGAVRRLDPEARPVRVVAFNKSGDANWGVPWHQDRVIAVAAQADMAGYRNWTNKSGTWHCEPPQDILRDMLFVRVHLDDTCQENGAMQIAVGSHVRGIVPSDQAAQEAKRYPIESCDAQRGDVLVLKMLTLHASKPARVQSGRRVLRMDFASSPLPLPLKWIPQNGASGWP